MAGPAGDDISQTSKLIEATMTAAVRAYWTRRCLGISQVQVVPGLTPSATRCKAFQAGARRLWSSKTALGGPR